MPGPMKDIALLVFGSLVALAWTALPIGGSLSIINTTDELGEMIGGLAMAWLLWLGFTGLALYGVYELLQVRAKLVEKEEW